MRSHMAGKQGWQRSDGEGSQERGTWRRPESLLRRLASFENGLFSEL